MCERIISIFSLILVLGLADISSADLVAHWDFEGDFSDAVGNNDATPQGDTATVLDSERSRVAEFDGTGDYIEIPNSASLNITGNELTAAAWVYFDDVAGSPEIVMAKVFNENQHTSPYFSYGLHILTNGTPRFWLVTNNAAGNAPGTTNLQSGRWYHMAGVYNGSQMILYVDGEVAATTNKSGNITGYDTVLRLGINGGFTEPMDGKLDDVRIYNHALDQVEIQAVMLQVGGGYPYAMALDPKDGAIHEDTWVTLSWRPGDFAVSHDVYMGDNFDDVNDGAGDTFRGNQGADSLFYVAGITGYAYPDGLVPGTTYYWRIDEVNEAEPNSPWKGDVWSFTVPPKTAYAPEPADSAEFIDLNVQLSWTAGFGTILHYIVFGEDFDEVNNAVTDTPNGTADYNPGPLNLAKTYYWRVDEFDGAATHKGEVWSFTTLGAVSGPNPANGAMGVSPTQILTWDAGAIAASHEVYFGSDADAVKNATKASQEYKGPKALGEESYDPDILLLETTYYWRIDEVNGVNPDSPWAGNIWSFTTGDFFVIDDFEDYNLIDNQIWWSWKDGLGYVLHDDEPAYPGNGTGSEVNAWEPITTPDIEQNFVHGGNQSMLLSYDNNKQGYAYYSEAEKTLTEARDWTEQGVTELSLWFRGYPASVGSFVEGPAGTYTMTGSGADIWYQADEFHYAFKMLYGTGSIVARVESVSDTHNWAKAGVMIRETLDMDSKHAMMVVTPGSGVSFQRRIENGGDSADDTTADITAPYWVKIERDLSGYFTTYSSANGSTWQKLGVAQPIPMSANVYIGLAVTAHNASATCEAVFTNVTITGSISGQWTNLDVGIESNDTEPLYVVVSNNTGEPAVVVHDNPAAVQIDNWTQWVIPLQAFADQGINLTNVDRIAIGLGTKGNMTVPGGSGKMYFDDIRLNRPKEAAAE